MGASREPMRQSQPRVSVIIPLYNTRDYLAETLQSLHAQAWENLEVIAVDDGSSDDSAELFLQLCPRGILFRQKNQGPSIARNTALHAAPGDYIAFLDGDDLWPEGKLARQVQRLEEDAQLEATLGFIRLFTDDPAVGRQWGTPFFLFLLGGMLARRSMFAPTGVGVFDAVKFPYMGEDTDWFLRAWESGRVMDIVEEPTIFYRRRSGSLTHNSSDTKRSFAGLIMTSLARRRSGGGPARPLPATLRIPALLKPGV